MATPITLDEFFEMAKLGGQIKAIHDIFEILQESNTQETMGRELYEYQESVLEKFKKAQLKFKMGGSKVRMDEESIDSLE
jgi:hypothetical protein